LLIEIYKENLVDPYQLGQDFAFGNMKEVIRKINAKKSMKKSLLKQVKDLFTKDEAYNIFVDFETRVPQAEELVRVNPLILSDRWGPVPDGFTKQSIKHQMAEGYANFESIGQIKDRITEVWDDCQGWRAELIARTETMRSFNSAGLDYYKQTKVVDKVELIIASDACPVCADIQSGQLEWAIGEAEGQLPFHPNCRCTWGPIVLDEVVDRPVLEEGPISDFLGTITDWQQLGGTASDTYIGFINDKKYLFKRDVPPNIGVPVKTSNLEAELLSSDAFQTAGLDAPNTMFGMFEHGARQERMLAMEWVDDVQTMTDFIALNGPRDYLDALDLYGFKKMQVVDVMIGNGDRHAGNFFFNNLGEVIPIDNGLAFATDRVITGEWQKCFLKEFEPGRYQTAEFILKRNQVGRDLIRREARAASKEAVLEMYRDTIAEIQETFTDDFIVSMVDKLPDTLVNAGRRQEIIETFTWRRDNLEGIIVGGFE